MQVFVPAACERRATDELELRAGVAMHLSLRIMLSPRVAVMRLLALLMHQRLGPECSSCLGERKKDGAISYRFILSVETGLLDEQKGTLVFRRQIGSRII